MMRCRKVTMALAALIVLSAVGATVATAVATTGHGRVVRHRKAVPARRRFAVLSHRVARRAGVTLGIPLGSVGQAQFYVRERPGPLAVAVGHAPPGPRLCLIELAGTGGGAACGPVAAAEREGIDAFSSEAGRITDAVLVPNGVTTVTFTDRNGTIHTVHVTNNFAAIEDANLATTHYVVPGGADMTIPVPEGGGQP